MDRLSDCARFLRPDHEVELIAFDCFRLNPHYHYGPRNKNERIFMDTTLGDDSLEWVLDQFKGRKLPAMIEGAGYPTAAATLDADLVATKVVEVETFTKAMRKRTRDRAERYPGVCDL